MNTIFKYHIHLVWDQMAVCDMGDNIIIVFVSFTKFTNLLRKIHRHHHFPHFKAFLGFKKDIN